MLEIGTDDFAGAQVDGEVAPFLRGNVGQLPFHHRLAGRNELNDRRMAIGDVTLDAFDQRHHLHAGDQAIEEPLLRALEGGFGGRLRLTVECAGYAGDVCGFERLIQIVMDHLKRGGIGVIDRHLLRRQGVLDDLDLDAFV